MKHRMKITMLGLLVIGLLSMSSLAYACNYDVCGCTLTPGYWKTHSWYGPAPYDDTWAQIGEDTPFYDSGKSWYEAMKQNSRGGNAYWILTRAYIAANLNILNGASTIPAVDIALGWAEGFFIMYTPSSYSQRPMAIYYAGILDKYNNGYIGPGHCSD